MVQAQESADRTERLDLDAIRQRNEARKRIKAMATAGPWRVERPRINYRIKAGDLFVLEQGFGIRTPEDATFIVHARNDDAEADVDALLAENERLQGLIDYVSAEANRLRTDPTMDPGAALLLLDLILAPNTSPPLIPPSPSSAPARTDFPPPA